MQAPRRSLWLEIDRAHTAGDRAQSIQVLADYCEEIGANGAARLLRDRVNGVEMPSPQDLSSIVGQMNRQSVRLYACACVDQVLPDSWSEARHALRITRRFEFGLATRESLIRIQQATFEFWRRLGAVPSGSVDRQVSWALVRATGMISRTRHPDNIHPDAIYVGRHTQRQEGWTSAQQAQAATEYLILGRMIDESTDMKEIWAEVNDLGIRATETHATTDQQFSAGDK